MAEIDTQELHDRLRKLSKHARDCEQGEQLERLEALAKQMEAIFDEMPFTDVELAKYHAKALTMIRSRYNNYKNPPKNELMTLRVHYANQAKQKASELQQQAAEGTLLVCCGPSTPGHAEQRDLCVHKVTLDPRCPNFVLFTWDHWLMRTEIHKEMLRCLQQDVTLSETFLEKYPSAIDDPFMYLHRNFVDPPQTQLQRDIKAELALWVDLDQYIDDLYGENVYLRCSMCNAESKSAATHPRVAEGRYLV